MIKEEYSKIRKVSLLLIALFLIFSCVFSPINKAYASESYTVTYDANGGTFSSGNTQNIVVYDDAPRVETRISKTSNVSDDGSSYSGNYSSAYSGVNDIITIEGATELKVTITYQIYNDSYSWVAIYDGSLTPTSANYNSSISGQLTGTTKTTKTFVIEGDTVQFFWRALSGRNYFGYYATVEATFETINSGTYEEPKPTNPASRFRGWYKDTECTEGNEFDLYDGMLSSNIEVYAKYEEVLESYSGTCGGCSWVIYEDGLLRIYPTDAISGTLDSVYNATSAPWYNYRTSVTSLVVEEGVALNTVAVGLFANLTNCVEMDLSKLDTSQVQTIYYMFQNSSSLKSLDLSNWNTSSVSDSLNSLFSGCSGLTTLDLTNFNTTNVTNMYKMFDNCSNLTSLDVSSFNTEKVTGMDYMFSGCSSLSTLDLSGFNTEKVTSMFEMFKDCNTLTNLNISSFNTESVTNMTDMFNNCSSLTVLDLSHFDTANVTAMCSGNSESGMFSGCSSLTSLNLSNWENSKVTSMEFMFNGCKNLINLDLTGFNTSSVTNMAAMFSDCSSLINLNLSSFDTSNAITLSSMFADCSSLTSLDLSNFDTSKVVNFSTMFIRCNSLTILNIKVFNTSQATTMDGIFQDCSSLIKIVFGENFDVVGNKLNLKGSWRKIFNFDGTEVNGETVYSSSELLALNNAGRAGTWERIYAQALYSTDDNSLTFVVGPLFSIDDTYNDKTIDKVYTGFDTDTYYNTNLVPWRSIRESIEKVIFEDVIKPTATACWFYDFKNCTEIDLSRLDISNSTNISYMFWNAGYNVNTFTIIGLEDWDTSKITNMAGVFCETGYNLNTFNLDLSTWDTSNVTNMSEMFYNAGYNAETFILNLGGWEINSSTNMENMFTGVTSQASKQGKLVLGENFKFNSNHALTNNWVKIRNPDGSKNYNRTVFTGAGLASLNNSTNPTIGGTWMINYTGDEHVTNPDGSVEYLSNDIDWNMISDEIWTYTFMVADDTLIYHLFEEVIDGYTSEAMAPYYITIKDNMGTIVNKKEDVVVEDIDGELIVTKKVEGTAAQQDFKFTITLTGSEISGTQVFNGVVFENGVGQFYLKDGETKKFNLPKDTQFKVEEAPYENYATNYNMSVEHIMNSYTDGSVATSGGSDVVSLDLRIFRLDENGNPVQGSNLQLINTNTGEVQNDWITDGNSKLAFSSSFNVNSTTTPWTAEGYAKAGGNQFNFLLHEVSAPDGYKRAEDMSLSFIELFSLYLDIYSSANKFNFVKDTEMSNTLGISVMKFTDNIYLSNNDEYIIVMSEEKLEGEDPSDAITGTIETSELFTVTVTNTYIPPVVTEKTENITLRKLIKGNISTDEKFNFNIYMANLKPNETYTLSNGYKFTTDAKGVVFFNVQLAANENVTIMNIPVGAKYRVIEKGGDYRASYEIVDKNKS